MSAKLGTIALALVLAGFGCSDGQTPEQPGEQPREVSWTTYESPTLGVRVPYPEGWHVEEDSASNATDFYASQPPADSDAPAELSYRKEAAGKARMISSFLAVHSTSIVTRSGLTMTRIVYPYDEAAAPDERMIAYIWEQNGTAYMLTGPEGSAHLEYSIDHLEVTP